MRGGNRAVVFLVGCMLAAGCSFNVGGTTVGGAGPGATPSPTQSVPDGTDGGGAPPSTGPDLAPPPERVGTACTSDADCDPGLLCAKTFGAGPNAVVIPGGYCTRDCSASACPANSVCVTFSFGRYCSSSCPPDPCRTSSGYVCCDVGMGQRACTTTALCGKAD